MRLNHNWVVIGQQARSDSVMTTALVLMLEFVLGVTTELRIYCVVVEMTCLVGKVDSLANTKECVCTQSWHFSAVVVTTTSPLEPPLGGVSRGERPQQPGVDGAEAEAAGVVGGPHLGHVVQQPAELAKRKTDETTRIKNSDETWVPKFFAQPPMVACKARKLSRSMYTSHATFFLHVWHRLVLCAVGAR